MPHLKPILLVEDSLNDIELVTHALRRNQVPNEIVAARHGGEALDYLYRRGPFTGRQDDDPLFVMLDLKMPRVTGLDVLRQIKSDEHLQPIPVVMLTSSNEESDLISSYRLGVNAYVVKPVDFERFVETIRQLGVFWATINQPPPSRRSSTAS